METTLPGHFDRVVVAEPNGRRELTVDEFLALPLSTRIRLVIDRSASFFEGRREVDRHAALDALRRARIAS